MEAAHGAARSKRTYLQAQYYRLAARRGRKRALVAVAHSLVVIIYQMLKRGTTYHDLGSTSGENRAWTSSWRLTGLCSKLSHFHCWVCAEGASDLLIMYTSPGRATMQWQRTGSKRWITLIKFCIIIAILLEGAGYWRAFSDHRTFAVDHYLPGAGGLSA